MSDVPLIASTPYRGVVHLRMNRPESNNALSPLLVEELSARLAVIAADTSARVVVLSGEGRAFSVGGDLADGLESFNGPPPLSAQTARLRSLMAAAQLLHELPQVTIAAINGACAGAGMSLALACDLRFSSSRTKFNSGFLAAGVSGDFGGVWFARRVLGSAGMRSLFLRPTPFSADTAARIGLVDQVLGDDGFEDAVLEIAASTADRAPLALRYLVENFQDAERLPLAEYLDVEAARHATCVSSADAQEAAAAFLEKRRPAFGGRKAGQ